MATKRKTATKTVKNQKKAVNKTTCNPISRPSNSSKTKTMTKPMAKQATQSTSSKSAAQPAAKTSLQPSSTRSIRFSYSDPNAQRVCLAGDFNNWNMNDCHLQKSGSGEWTASLNLKPGVYDYRFVVDGEWRDDPKSQELVFNEYGTQNARIVVK